MWKRESVSIILWSRTVIRYQCLSGWLRRIIDKEKTIKNPNWERRIKNTWEIMIIYFVLNSLFTITTGIESIFLYCDDNRNECAYALVFLHPFRLSHCFSEKNFEWRNIFEEEANQNPNWKWRIKTIENWSHFQ